MNITQYKYRSTKSAKLTNDRVLRNLEYGDAFSYFEDEGLVVTKQATFRLPPNSIKKLIEKSDLIQKVRLKKVNKDWYTIGLDDSFGIPVEAVHILREQVRGGYWLVYYTNDPKELINRPKDMPRSRVTGFKNLKVAKLFAEDYAKAVFSEYYFNEPSSRDSKYDDY